MMYPFLTLTAGATKLNNVPRQISIIEAKTSARSIKVAERLKDMANVDVTGNIARRKDSGNLLEETAKKLVAMSTSHFQEPTDHHVRLRSKISRAKLQRTNVWQNHSIE